MVCSKATTLVGCPPMTSSGGQALLSGVVNDECLSASSLSMLSDRLTTFPHPTRSPHLSKQHLTEEQIPSHEDAVLFGSAGLFFEDPKPQNKVEESLTTNAAPIKKFIYQCLEDTCTFKSIHRERFIIHLRCLHHIEVDERMLEFPDWNTFQQWKTSLEAETRAKFVKPYPSHRVQYYQNQNLESQVFHCAWLERSKQLDSSRWKPCIGHMIARRSVHTGKVSVYCILSHYGHSSDQNADSAAPQGCRASVTSRNTKTSSAETPSIGQKSNVAVNLDGDERSVEHSVPPRCAARSNVTLLVNQVTSATTYSLGREMPVSLKYLENDSEPNAGSRVIKVVRPVTFEKTFPLQRDSDLEVDSDFSIGSSGDECERPRFKSVLRVARKDGKIVHERTKVPLADNEPAPLRVASAVSQFHCIDCASQGSRFVTSKRQAFVHHLMEEHSLKPEENIYVFSTFSKFVAFKTRLESKLKCAFVLRRKCGKEWFFECSRSGRYRIEKAAVKAKTRCTARIIASTKRDGFWEAKVCSSHYGHDEESSRLNVSKRHASKIAQLAASRSSRDIFQIMVAAGARHLTRDAVKSIVGYMRCHEGRFDYQAWQREVFNVQSEAFKDSLRRSVQKLMHNNPKLQQRLIDRLPDLVPNAIRSGCDSVGLGVYADHALIASSDSVVPSLENLSFAPKQPLNILEGDDSDWEGSDLSASVSDDEDVFSKLRRGNVQHQQSASSIVVSAVNPEDGIGSVSAREVLRRARTSLNEEEPEDGGLENGIQDELVEERLATAGDVDDDRVERPCDDLIGDRMGNVLIENEDVATNLLREIFHNGSTQHRAQDGDHNHNSTTSSSGANNNNSSSGSSNNNNNNNNDGEASNGQSESETQDGDSEKSENDSSSAQAQDQSSPSSKDNIHANIEIANIIEARLKDTLQLTDQEQALKRSIEEAIFTNPVRYELSRAPGRLPQQRKVSSSDDDSSEGEKSEPESPKVTTKFHKALASVRNIQKEKNETHKRKLPDPESQVPSKVKVLVMKRNEEPTEAQRAHDYRDKLMGTLAGPSVARHDPKAPSPSGSTPHGKKKLAVQATDRGNKK